MSFFKNVTTQAIDSVICVSWKKAQFERQYIYSYKKQDILEC